MDCAVRREYSDADRQRGGNLMQALETLLHGTPYISYTYAYPHKTAYRAFETPLPLREVWASENRQALFLYLHIPFCEMRCGFCNLFTTVNAGTSIETAYLDALEREAVQTYAALGTSTFARMALGGGTPTYLDVHALARLFDLAQHLFGVLPASVPVSVETSPQTADPEKLALLRERGVDRISIGVQSFDETEVHAVGRPQTNRAVEQALRTIRDSGCPTLNIDLMYGLPAQTVSS